MTLEKSVVLILLYGMMDDLWRLRDDKITASDNKKRIQMEDSLKGGG